VSATFRLEMAMLPMSPEFFFRTDYSIEGSRYSQVHNLAETGSSNLWNFRAGLDADNWTLTVFVNNAFNDSTPVDILRFVDASRPGLSPATPPLGGSPFSGYNPFLFWFIDANPDRPGHWAQGSCKRLHLCHTPSDSTAGLLFHAPGDVPCRRFFSRCLLFWPASWQRCPVTLKTAC